MNLLQSILNTLAGPDLIAAFQRCLFWSTIVAVGALLLAVTVILFKRTSGVADSLESQAREALGMSRLPYGIRRVPDALRHSYFPSPGAIVLLVAMLVLVVVLNTTAPLRGLVVLPWNVDKWAPSTVDALLGLASAVFALVLFIAESLRSQDGSDRGRVLLKESWLFPIVVMVIGFTIVPLLSTPSSWIFAFSVVVVGGLLIRAFYMVISILTDFPYFERKRRLFLTQRLKSVMTELIVGRLISNRFLKLIEESDHLQYRLSDRLLSKGPTDHEFKVSCPRSGVFNNALPRAVLKLDRKLRALFAARVFPTDDSLLPPPDATKEKDKYCFLVVRPGGPIDRDQTIAVVRPPKKISQGQQRELEQLVRDILRIGDPAPVDLYIQDFANLQKHAAIAIREGAANALEDDRKHYLALVTTFFDSLPKDVRYDAATARKEIYSLEGGWKPIASLRDHIKQLLDIAVAEGSDEAMYQLAFMPMHLVGAAIQRQDQYIIKSF
ncbi:MAG: hypothetical protein OEY32_05545 [Candidatus Krumholzibacteria bacterium]|nr:hypothetical protein [Candidatus Krumholzibacteria bacterium]